MLERIDNESRRALLDSLQKHAPIWLAFIDRESRYTWTNSALSVNAGAAASELLGQRVEDVVPLLWPQLQPLYARALAGESLFNHEIVGAISAQHPEVRHWLVSHFPVQQDGEITDIGEIVSDISERVRTKHALAVRNNLYAMLSRTNRAVSRSRSKSELFADLCRIAVDVGRFRFAWIGVPDDGRLSPVARAGEDTGYLTDLVISLDPADPRSQGPTGRAARLGETIVVNDFATSPMTALWHARAALAGLAASAAFPLMERGVVVAVLTLYAATPGFFTDDLVTTLRELTPSVSFALDGFINERERLQRDADLRLRDRAIAAVTQGIVISDATDPNLPIIYASPGFVSMSGYPLDEILGRNCRFMQGRDTDPIALESVRRALATGEPCTVELLNYRRDGTTFWNSLALSPLRDEHGRLTHVVGVQTDVTDRRRAEAASLQSQKMEALGRLAGGVAHDFNNLLTIIRGYSDLAMQDLSTDDPQREALEQIRIASEHATQLTRQLLTFSRQESPQAEPLSLNAAVRETATMLRRLLGSRIALVTDLAAADDLVRVNQGQMTQLIINIAVNARDAMPEGGELHLSTSSIDVDSAALREMPELAPGRYVVLRIRDTGAGMDELTRSHIFEPFFTTKSEGKGTGLGLATVHGIVTQARGQISVSSEVGAGTTFTIMLPAIGVGG